MISVWHEEDVFGRHGDGFGSKERIGIHRNEIVAFKAIVDLVVVKHEIEHRPDHPALNEIGVVKGEFAINGDIAFVGGVEDNHFRAVFVVVPVEIIASSIIRLLFDRVFVSDQNDLIAIEENTMEIAAGDFISEDDIERIRVDDAELVVRGKVQIVAVRQERVAFHNAVDLIVRSRIRPIRRCRARIGFQSG